MTDQEWMENRLAASRKAFPTGSQWRVKASAKRGLTVYGGSKHDTVAHPKEVGTVIESTYTATDGSTQTTRKLEFERGRRLSVESLDDYDLTFLAKIPKTVRAGAT